jgi:flagellar motor switch protein FliG
MVTAATSFNGKQKAATVLMSVDAGVAAEIMRNFSEDELASIAFEMNNLGKIEPRAEAGVLHEFSVRASADDGIVVNPNAVRDILTLAIGNDGALNVLKDIGLENDAEELFRPLRDLGAPELHGLLVDEHPQTVALVLSQLDSKSSANVLALFPEESQMDLVRRMASTKHTDENMVRRVGQIMQQKMGTIRETHQTPEDPRYKRVADMINNLGSEVEERILEELTSNVPEMAEKLRDMMFVFEDIKSLSDDDIRKVLMSVDTQVLAMSLKTASDELKDKVFTNLSRRATETVNEELELLGPKPLSQVKSAQQKIVGTIRKMSSAGEVNIKSTVAAEEDPLV